MFDIDTGALAETSLAMGAGGFGVVADQAAFNIFAFLNASLSQSQQLPSPDTLRALLTQAGIGGLEAQGLGGQEEARLDALIAAVMGAVAGNLAGTPANNAAPTKPQDTIEELKRAAIAAQEALKLTQAEQEALKLKQAQIEKLEAERAKKQNAEKAKQEELKEQNRRMQEKLKQQQELQQAAKKAMEELALEKQTATGQAKQLAELNKNGPPSTWPAWMGQNPAYAPVYGNAVSTAANTAAFASYEGEARGSDSLGNQTEGGFYAEFREDNGTVHVDGVLLGLEFLGRITNPAFNRFQVDINRGSSEVTSGADGFYSGGTLDGRFFGGGHEAVGGGFSLTGEGGTRDMNGHFAGAVAP